MGRGLLAVALGPGRRRPCILSLSVVTLRVGAAAATDQAWCDRLRSKGRLFRQTARPPPARIRDVAGSGRGGRSDPPRPYSPGEGQLSPPPSANGKMH